MGTVTKKLFAMGHLLSVLLSVFPADFGSQIVAIAISELKGLADKLIDKVENEIADSENKIDDKYLLPAIDRLRAEFNIPDND